MLRGSSWWALVRRWHRRGYRGRSGFFREVSWEWCPELASYVKQICVTCPLVNWNSIVFELTVQCWQCPPPVRWCRPWACTRRALAVCHLGSMLGRAKIGMLEYLNLKRKPVAGYIKIPPYFSVRWTSATIEPMYLRKRNDTDGSGNGPNCFSPSIIKYLYRQINVQTLKNICNFFTKYMQ